MKQTHRETVYPPVDMNILRSLAGEYAEIALKEDNLAIADRYRDLNSLKACVRPPVLVFEEPWGEIKDDELYVMSKNHRKVYKLLKKNAYKRLKLIFKVRKLLK